MNLSQYIRDTARLLRDRSNILTPVDELTDYINQGRNDVARLTGCIRCLVAGNAPFGGGATPGLAIPGAATPGAADTTILTFSTIASVEKYHFGYAKPFLHAQFEGVDSVSDLIEVAVSWGSASRPVMEWCSFEELQALSRIYSVGVFTYPFKAALQGDGANQVLFLFPVPGLQLEMEWDATCLPKPLRTNNDYEAIPEPYDNAVKFFAAMYAFQATQRYGSATMMENMGLSLLGSDRVATERGRVPSYYDIA
jgi:hypothetical protein